MSLMRRLRTVGWRFAFCLGSLACLWLAGSPAASWGAEFRATGPFRMLVSEGVIGAEVNESDADVAMQAWRAAVAKEVGFQMEVRVANLAKLIHEVRDGQVDGFSSTTLEFLAVQNYSSQSLVIDEPDLNGGNEYLLLVHQDSGIQKLADLQHKLVNVYDNREMSLASLWLETVLAEANLGPPADFFSRLSVQNKLSRVVLPVYFRQADACLVTRRAFATMAELNPQLQHKLRSVATSPKFITSMMAFHKDCPLVRRQQFENAVVNLHKTAAGRQALTLFQSGQLVMSDMSMLRSALDLVKEHERLYSKTIARKK